MKHLPFTSQLPEPTGSNPMQLIRIVKRASGTLHDQFAGAVTEPSYRVNP